jgi:hypothetical protein
MPLFFIYLIFSSTYIQSITFIKYIHPSPFAEVPSPYPHRWSAQWEKHLSNPEPNFGRIHLAGQYL